MTQPARRAYVTDAEVFKIADALTAEGITPSQARVRAALGGGSYATISPALARWRKARQEPATDALPTTLKAKLSPLLDDLWAMAMRLARSEFDQQRADLEARLSSSAAAQAQAEERAANAELQAKTERELRLATEETIKALKAAMASKRELLRRKPEPRPGRVRRSLR